MTGFIYAIRCGDFVKLGYATDVFKRRSQIGLANPLPVTLIGYSRGSRADEIAIHREFTPWRVRGEWFQFVGPIAAFVEQMDFHGALPNDRRRGPRPEDVQKRINDGIQRGKLRRETLRAKWAAA